MPQPLRFLVLGALAYPALLLGMVGCGDENALGRLAVSGKITLDGIPLDQGSIEFAPYEQSSISSGAMVKDGAYSIPADKGLPPGKYLVRIFSPVETTSQKNEPSVPGPTVPSQPPPGVERIPPEYNTKSQHIIEIKPNKANQFDFDIR